MFSYWRSFGAFMLGPFKSYIVLYIQERCESTGLEIISKTPAPFPRKRHVSRVQLVELTNVSFGSSQQLDA